MLGLIHSWHHYRMGVSGFFYCWNIGELFYCRQCYCNISRIRFPCKTLPYVSNEIVSMISIFQSFFLFIFRIFYFLRFILCTVSRWCYWISFAYFGRFQGTFIIAWNCLISIPSSTLFFILLFKRNHFYVIPWLANGVAFAIITLLFILFEIYTGINIFVAIVGTVFILVKTGNNCNFSENEYSIQLSTDLILNFALNIIALLVYAWIAAYSLYITLRNVAISKNQLPA